MFTYGVLRKDNFVMINGTSLKGSYVGQTGPKVQAVVQQAMGGTLFIDEAYNLSAQNPGQEADQFARDVIGTLLTEIENNRTGIMVIMGGYKNKMDRLMRFDPGLQRRFPKRLHLPDYSAMELSQICQKYALHRFEKKFDSTLTLKSLEKYMTTFHSTKMPKFNAGLAVEMVENAVQMQTARIGRMARQMEKEQIARKLEIRKELGRESNDDDVDDDVDDDEEYKGENKEERSQAHGKRKKNNKSKSFARLRQTSNGAAAAKKELAIVASLLTPEDFGMDLGGPKIGDDELIAEVEAEFNKMVGLDQVKEFFFRLKKSVEFVERGGNPRILKQNLNLILTGNPGTGKTTIARLMAKYLHALGVLPHDRFVEKNGLELKGMYVGHTSHVVKEAVADAMGGCLFVDEGNGNFYNI